MDVVLWLDIHADSDLCVGVLVCDAQAQLRHSVLESSVVEVDT